MQYCKTVTLRTRPIKNGMLSFYLDYYPGYRDIVTMKTTRHESLGIYIYADPQNKREKEFNEIMTEKAEAIRCRRFESVVNERYDFFDKSKMHGDFLDYFNRVLQGKDPKWKFVYEHFKYFVGGKCRCEEVDIDLEEVAAYVCKRAKDEGFCSSFNPEEVFFIVQADLDFQEQNA